jgi:hypothetical protein
MSTDISVSGGVVAGSSAIVAEYIAVLVCCGAVCGRIRELYQVVSEEATKLWLSRLQPFTSSGNYKVAVYAQHIEGSKQRNQNAKCIIHPKQRPKPDQAHRVKR